MPKIPRPAALAAPTSPAAETAPAAPVAPTDEAITERAYELLQQERLEWRKAKPADRKPVSSWADCLAKAATDLTTPAAAPAPVAAAPVETPAAPAETPAPAAPATPSAS